MTSGVTVIRPELTEEERRQRRKEIEEAVAKLIIAIRQKQKD